MRVVAARSGPIESTAQGAVGEANEREKDTEKLHAE
jgi:hypothetical protein